MTDPTIFSSKKTTNSPSIAIQWLNPQTAFEQKSAMNAVYTCSKSLGPRGNAVLMPLSVSAQVLEFYTFLAGLQFQCILSLAEAPIHSVGYQSLVGNNEHSWGWDLGRNKVYHNSKVNPGNTYPSNLKHDETFVVPDKFLGK